MTRQSGDQPTRRLTVAELLAKNQAEGGSTSSGRRHRRRAPEDDVESELTTTAPQEIIDRIHAEQPQVDWESHRSNGHSALDPGLGDSLDTPTKATRAGRRVKAEPPRAEPVKRPEPPKRPEVQRPEPKRPEPVKRQEPVKPVTPEPPRGGRTGSGYSPAVQPPAQRPRWQPPAQDPLRDSGPRPDAIVDRLNGSRSALSPVQPATSPPPSKRAGTPPPPSKRAGTPPPPSKPMMPPVPPPPRRAPLVPAEGITDEFDVVEDEYVYDDDLDYIEDELGDDEPELLAGRDEPVDVDELDEDAEELSPGQQWLAVGAQLAAGVVGGALVWLLFNWLWNSLPAVALVAALIVTAGLVWIVRNIRKAEDMQSTVLAVLVGLVVTVSPAALLLLSR